jgi:hypothetical protein
MNLACVMGFFPHYPLDKKRKEKEKFHFWGNFSILHLAKRHL